MKSLNRKPVDFKKGTWLFHIKLQRILCTILYHTPSSQEEKSTWYCFIFKNQDLFQWNSTKHNRWRYAVLHSGLRQKILLWCLLSIRIRPLLKSSYWNLLELNTHAQICCILSIIAWLLQGHVHMFISTYMKEIPWFQRHYSWTWIEAHGWVFSGLRHLCCWATLHAENFVPVVYYQQFIQSPLSWKTLATEDLLPAEEMECIHTFHTAYTYPKCKFILKWAT